MKNKMNYKNKITVSVGIPVYNEANTIASLLNSIFNQNNSDYFLENVYIICDGSTDGTGRIVKNLFSNKKEIKIISHKRREGKAKRLLEIYKKNQSDILIIFDGDLFINDKNLVNKLMKGFRDDSVVLVSANNQPLRPKNFFGKIWYAVENMWYETRKDYNHGDNLYNNSGCSVALRKQFAKSIFLPKYTIADQQFVYINAIKMHKQFKFVNDAFVYYNPPSTISDIKLQFSRSIREEDFFEKFYDESFRKYFYISRKHKILGFLRSVVKDPVFTLIALVLLRILYFTVQTEDPLISFGLWDITKSTKINHH